MTLTVQDLEDMHEDAKLSAERAGLVYIEGAPAGIRRRKYGKGFRYLDAANRPVGAAEKERIVALAIPPAWRSVWISADPDGHILATGEDERGRKQYLYHPRWRELRDLINYYRLIVVARSLPPVRSHVAAQLRRRTLDRDRVVAGMLGLLDAHRLRVGNEAYVEENESYGLSTLTAEHLDLSSRRARLTFPAKSGQVADVVVEEPGLVRLLRELAAQNRERLFTVDDRPVDSDEVNDALAELTGEHITAKDYRTWGGTLVAFGRLRPHADAPVPEQLVLAAIDAAAEALGNTRAVARAHYVHPHVLASAEEGTLADNVKRGRRPRAPELSGDERALAGLLPVLFDDHLAAELGRQRPGRRRTGSRP